jgi:hypothetical protein
MHRHCCPKGNFVFFLEENADFQIPNITQHAGLLQLKNKILLLSVEFPSSSETKAP